MKELFLIGAGGHARSVIALLQRKQFLVKGIYDAGFLKAEYIFDIPVIGSPESIEPSSTVVLSVGDSENRKKLFERFRSQVFSENIVHPSAALEKYVSLGSSNLIFANCYLNNGVELGINNLINTSAILEHEVVLGSHNHIAVRASLLGRSKVGNKCFIGAGAVIRDGISVCDDVVIGAQSYVAADIKEPGIYVGSPARKLK
jgi:UDP-N-acetylbacillosamine N-acetyltransferase